MSHGGLGRPRAFFELGDTTSAAHLISSGLGTHPSVKRLGDHFRSINPLTSMPHTRVSAVDIVCMFVGRGVVFVLARSLQRSNKEKEQKLKRQRLKRILFVHAEVCACVCVFCVYFNCLHSPGTKTKDRFRRFT